MPELPDLEVAAENLQKRLHGKRVSDVKVVRPKRVHATEQELRKALKGASIEKVRREGKELRIDFSSDNTLGIHLMLNGEMVISEKGEDAKYVTMELRLSDHSTLAITDRQAWVTVELNPESSPVPDALGKDFTLNHFLAQTHRKPSLPIKMLLVDQDVVQGIGNAYSDEILWHARVDPESKVKDLPEDVRKKIYHAISKVLKQAIKDMKKAHPGMINGEPREHLAVHNNGAEKSPTGKPILTKDVKGKKSYYTKEQKLYD